MTATGQRGTGEHALKRAFSATLNLPDRLLHRRRHLSLRRRLNSMQQPQTILVVCQANVCRSPYLHAVLQSALPHLSVTSAGFFGSGRPVPQVSVDVCAKRGFDLSLFRSRPLTQALLTKADLLIVMDPAHAVRIARSFRVKRGRIVIAGDLDPRFDSTRGIRDPWQQSSEVFESAFDRLDRCAATLARIFRVGRMSGTKARTASEVRQRHTTDANIAVAKAQHSVFHAG